ncbi:MAG: PHP domain-containing protein [Vicinamibacterales bacterium]
MIDLHLHTTASDGRLTPGALVARAAAAGLRTISVTDHDTVAAIDEVARLADVEGMRVVSGTEITAVHDSRDVHVLGYFFDHHDRALLAFLDEQRARRVARAREIAARLDSLAVPIDLDRLLTSVPEGGAIARPLLARLLVEAGHVASVQDAFDRFLADGRPAFVPRTGHSPEAVVGVIHAAGGLASFAHPGVTRQDPLIAPLVAHGLDAIEVYHSDHPPETRAKYGALAETLGALVTGGSDFHGESEAAGSGRERRAALGEVHLPAADFSALEACAAAGRRE